VIKEAVGFYVAESPQSAVDALEEDLAPEVPAVQNLTMVMAGEDLKYKQPVLN
jgi:hypothetical protein